MSAEEVLKKDSFVKGHTQGSYELSEERMRFNGESKKWFDIPLKALSNAKQGGNKIEIALEFNKDEEIEDSAICKIKLFIPDKQNQKKEKEKWKKKTKTKKIGRIKLMKKKKKNLLKQEQNY